MERFYATTLKARGFPTCHFVKDRTIAAPVGIVHRTATSAKKEAKRRNDEQGTQPWVPFYRPPARALTSTSIVREIARAA
jgi:hypothetical protein